MIALPFQELERVTRVAPLGLRFVDDATGMTIGGGLTVEAYPAGHPEQRRRSCETRSGLHSLQGLPGLREAEYGRVPGLDERAGGEARYWEQVAQKPFTVEVLDSTRRFLPARFSALAPSRGVSGLVCAAFSQSTASQPGVPIFSSPSRELPESMIAVRAELWDADRQVAAAWALVEVTASDSTLARGLSDGQGRVAVFLRPPAPLGFVVDPEASQSVPLTGPPLLDQSWPCTIRAFWSVASLSPPGSPSDALVQLGALDVPDLCTLLAQPPARLSAVSGVPLAQLDASIHFGRDLVLRTMGDDRGRLLLNSP